MPQEGDERLLHQSQTVLKRNNLAEFPSEFRDQLKVQENLQLKTANLPLTTDLAASLSAVPSLLLPDWLRDSLKEAYEVDPLPSEILEALDNNLPKHSRITLADCSQNSGLLFYQNRLYIPDLDELKAALLRETHDNLSAGHPGRTKTYELLHRNFYWPGIINM